MISNEEQRKRCIELLATVREEYEEIIQHEVQLAIAADQEAIDRLCSKYLDNVRAYTTREKIVDDRGQMRDPDERLMRAVEEKAEIPESRKDDFRHELMNYIAAIHLEGKTFDYRQNQRLTRALELMTSLVSTVVDPDTKEKIAVIRDRLMRRFGYDEISANEVLHEVANLFARPDPEAGEEASGRGAAA
jgi:serine protein kinase